MATSSITIQNYQTYKQQFPAHYSDSMLAYSYGVYVKTFKDQFECQIDTAVPEVVAPLIPSFVHLHASKPGYCYLYLFKEKFVYALKRTLGSNPALGDVLRVIHGGWNLNGLSELRISVTSNGGLHIGTAGTWPILDFLGYLLKTGVHLPVAVARRVNMVDIAWQVTMSATVGWLEDRGHSLNFPFIRSFGLDGVCDIGDRAILRHVSDSRDFVVVRTMEGLFVTVDSAEGDGNLPVVSYGYVQDEHYVVLKNRNCQHCKERTSDLNHFLHCESELDQRVMDLSPSSKFYEFKSDMAAHFSRSKDYAGDIVDAEILYTMFYTWWVLNGNPVVVPVRQSKPLAFKDRNIYLNYSGVFKSMFLACLNHWRYNRNYFTAIVDSLVCIGGVPFNRVVSRNDSIVNFDSAIVDAFPYDLRELFVTNNHLDLFDYALIYIYDAYESEKFE